MVWIRFEDSYLTNSKVLKAGRDGRDLHQACIFHAGRELTDGFIAAEAMPIIAAMAGIPDLSDALRRCLGATGRSGCGLLEEAEGGYMVHDFLAYNPSREEVEHNRQIKAEAGRAGGIAKARQAASTVPSTVPSKAASKSLAKTYPVPDPVPDPQESTVKRKAAPSAASVSAWPDRAEIVSWFGEDRKPGTFWGEWPTGHKQDRDRAQVLFVNIFVGNRTHKGTKTREEALSLRDAIMAGLKAWKASDRWQRGVVRGAAVWLGNRNWTEEAPAAEEPIQINARRGNGQYGSRSLPLPTREEDDAYDPFIRTSPAAGT